MTRISGATAMPRSGLRIFDFKKETSVFEPHVRTNGKPALSYLFFVGQVVVAFGVFRNRCAGHMSYLAHKRPKNNKKMAGFPFAGWCMINTV